MNVAVTRPTLHSSVVFIVLALLAMTVAPVQAATSTLLSPTTVALPNVGDSATVTVTITAPGVAANTVGMQMDVVHDPALVSVTNLRCIGVFNGFSAPTPRTTRTGTRLACLAVSPAAATSGDAMSFTVTRLAGLSAGATTTVTVSTDSNSSMYAHRDGTTESLGTVNSVLVTATSPAPTAVPTSGSTPRPAAAGAELSPSAPGSSLGVSTPLAVPASASPPLTPVGAPVVATPLALAMTTQPVIPRDAIPPAATNPSSPPVSGGTGAGGAGIQPPFAAPPGPAPSTGAAAPVATPGAAGPALGEVPVVPEAESSTLLLGSLVATAALWSYRAWSKRR